MLYVASYVDRRDGHVVVPKPCTTMAGNDSQKLQDKLQEMVKLLSAGKGNREDTAAVLSEASQRLAALEVSNRRLREDARGPAQMAWTKFMTGAIRGHISHEAIAFDYDDSKWQMVLDNCEDIADGALVRWKMRWMDGTAPVRRPRRHGEGSEQPAKPGDAAAEAPSGGPPDLGNLFDSEPRPGRWGPKMVDASSPHATTTAAPVPEPGPAATDVPAPQASPKPESPLAPKPEPPKTAPKVEPPKHPAPTMPRERQPGDD